MTQHPYYAVIEICFLAPNLPAAEENAEYLVGKLKNAVSVPVREAELFRVERMESFVATRAEP